MNASAAGFFMRFIKNVIGITAFHAVFMVFVTTTFCTVNGEDIHLDSTSGSTVISQIIAPSNPFIRNDSIIYSMEMSFVSHVGKLWSYIDTRTSIAAVEIYGTLVTPPSPTVVLPRCSPVRNMTVKSQSTKMSLSGIMSVISFTIDKEWKFDLVQPDSTKIRLVFSKKMAVKDVKHYLEYKKKSFMEGLGAALGGAVSISILIAAIMTR
jgi:hypothetical protein